MAAAHTSSVGHVLSAGEWLDSHFAACREEYEAMFREAPLPAGGVVLDAGCGTGPFLSLLSEAVGPEGRLVALDMAPEHLQRLRGSNVDPIRAGVNTLPLRAASLDVIWCANVTQFFNDAGLAGLLAEFRRALKPGGLLAVKDLDMTGWRIEPAPPFLGLHLAEACAGEDATDQSLGSIRGRRLRGLLGEAGFENVQQRTRTIERWAPLDDLSARFWAEWLAYLAGVAATRRLPAADAAFWSGLQTAGNAHAFVSRPDFYGCEMQVVAFGQASRLTPG